MNDFQTRQTLLQKLQDQYDGDAWKEFYGIYQDFIFAVVRKMKFDIHDAEDISQKVLLKAWEKLPSFQYNCERGNFRSWLTVITRNQARMEMRSKYRDFDNPFSKRHMQLKVLMDSWTEPEIEKISELEWQKYIVAKAWNNVEPTLGPKVRQAYEMLVHGESVMNTASSLQIETNTVYRHRRRVEKMLQKEIQRLEVQFG